MRTDVTRFDDDGADNYAFFLLKLAQKHERTIFKHLKFTQLMGKMLIVKQKPIFYRVIGDVTEFTR